MAVLVGPERALLLKQSSTTCWSQCLLRRNYKSALPEGSNNTIGRSLPRCKMAVLDLTFSEEAHKVYDSAAEPYLRRLFI